MPSYRYIKRRYKRLYIRKELYEKLQALAEKEGLTVPSLIEKLYNFYISPNIRGNIQHNIMPNTDSQSSTTGITPNIQHNISPNTAQRGTVVKCFPRAKMKRPIKDYVDYYESKGILADWWEEGGDRVCFELKAVE